MYIELLILIQIEESPKHGYEIKKEIQKDLGYLTDVNNNMLYPALRKFTEEGLVTKRMNEQSGGPTQYIYEITENGRRRITDLVNVFTERDAKHQSEFLIRVSLFRYISPDNRLRILNMRMKDLEQLLFDLEERQEQHNIDRYRDEVLRLSIFKLKAEQDWIHKLMEKVDREKE
ncbi:PadR family transcriptional regulator [Paenibacillus urinalis]|uniref:PadR family transcriptional regulator n=1 Tax=Paenibacillus urinalis TaxID=521520 RepID=A0AAX3N5H3_9BACL|nr:PadR family transcriptional regulator [Paenibacillus urinalis]WDH84882.1 PadR family transcriptional regulator [Paenibacillus urinalis]